MRILTVMKPQSDSGRIFVTALLVYAAFLNPWIHSSMKWNFLDAGVSYVDTGRWEMAHAEIYHKIDTATVNGRVVSGEPPGMSVLIMPFYVVWRVIVGPLGTAESFQAFNAFLALVLGATASAFLAVQVAWFAGWLGAERRGQILAAILVAFGTPNFFFGTNFFKENFAALAVMGAARLAVGRGSLWHRAAAGAVAGMATWLAYTAGLLAPLLLLLVYWREGTRRAAAFILGYVPLAIALGVFNARLFGQPWRTGYLYLTEITTPHFAVPKVRILFEFIVGTEGGLLLYAPFLWFAFTGLVWAWRTGHRAEAWVAGVMLVGLWIAGASWQSQFSDQASWAHTLGPRMMFPAIPLLAAFAGSTLEKAGRGIVLSVVVPSVLCGYLGAQAGFIPNQTTSNSFFYAVQTCISGTGMGVFFKEALPMWFGVDTLHTLVSRPDISAADLLSMLPTEEGFRLVRNQALFLGVNLVVLWAVAKYLRRIWQGPKNGSKFACGF